MKKLLSVIIGSSMFFTGMSFVPALVQADDYAPWRVQYHYQRENMISSLNIQDDMFISALKTASITIH